jgi:hypothetical protein
MGEGCRFNPPLADTRRFLAGFFLLKIHYGLLCVYGQEQGRI